MYQLLLFYLFTFSTSPLNNKPFEVQKLDANSIYSHLPNAQKLGLKKIVFEKAIKGYSYLLNKGNLKNKRYITICDMSQSSAKKRLFIIDLTTQKIVFNLRVAHGSGSGEEFAAKFSDQIDSHQTSLGFYVTGGTYEGENGPSLKLKGMESGFNSNAFERAIVMHGSDYTTDQYFKTNKKIGRSWGCPSISKNEIEKVLPLIKNGSCLYIYHPNKEYHKKSKIMTTNN